MKGHVPRALHEALINGHLKAAKKGATKRPQTYTLFRSELITPLKRASRGHLNLSMYVLYLPSCHRIYHTASELVGHGSRSHGGSLVGCYRNGSNQHIASCNITTVITTIYCSCHYVHTSSNGGALA